MPPRPARKLWRFQKRRRAADEEVGEDAEGVELREFFQEAMTLNSPNSTFNMDCPQSRAQLAVALWGSTPLLGDNSALTANPNLASVLEILIRNSYEPDDREAFQERVNFRLEGILTGLLRAQSQKQMPVLTARMSVAFLRNQVHTFTWHMVNLLAPGIVASRSWTKDFIRLARTLRPACPYEPLPGVAGVMFDNYTTGRSCTPAKSR